jgi:hypothetical protein
VDSLGNRSDGDNRKRRHVAPRPKGQVLRADSQTMSAALHSIPVRHSQPKPEPEPRLHCPLCPQNVPFRGQRGFWNHLMSDHHPGELLAALKAFPMNEADPLDDIEATLIRIVNSLDHESAIEIATAALCGKEV